MCSQVELRSKGLIGNNGGTNSHSLDMNPIGVAVFNFQNDRVFEHQYVIQVGGQCQLNIIFRGNGAFTGFHRPKGLSVCLQHKIHGNMRLFLAFPSACVKAVCTSNAPHCATQHQTFFFFSNQSSWVFVGFSFCKKQSDSEEQTYNSASERPVRILYISFAR